MDVFTKRRSTGDLKETSVLQRQRSNTARYKRHEGNYDDSSSSSEIDIRPKKQSATVIKFKDKEQVCLAKAIQKYSQHLVEFLPFNESEIPDGLLDGCLTEDECSSVRQIPGRKDQIRKLVLLMKGRSFETMEMFLAVIKHHCSETVENIWKDYKTQLECVSSERPTFPIEKMKRDVNIKYVVDFLWTNGVISDVLFHDITHCDRPAGDQDSLWNKLLQSCEDSNKMHELCNALAQRRHYDHIVKGILNELKLPPNDGIIFKGHIKPHVPSILQNMTGVRDSATTYSPRSSASSNIYSLSEVTENEEEAIQNEASVTHTMLQQSSSSEQSFDKHDTRLIKTKQRKQKCCHWPRFIFPCFSKQNSYSLEKNL